MSEILSISGHCYGIGSIGYKLNVSRQKAWYPDLRQDITYSKNDVPIAAIEYMDFSPNKILNVISREDSKFENTAGFYLIETLSKENDFFPSTHYPYVSGAANIINYLVTDILNKEGKPLFYQYELLYDAHSFEGGEIITLYKNNEIKVNPSNYIIQCSYDLLSDGSIRYSDTTWTSLDLSKQTHRVRLLLPLDVAERDDFFTVDYEKSIYGARTPQRELLELTPVFTQGIDFIVTSGVSLHSTKINHDTKILYLIKDPNDRIKPIGIEPPSYQPDQLTSWRLRLNPGSLLTQSGIYNNESGRFYNLPNIYALDYITTTNIKPVYISENILKVDQYPIYVDPDYYSYPNYKINLYDKESLLLNTNIGNMAIEVNGISRTDIKVLSIDRKKGYIQLNESLNPSDEIELDFFLDPAGYMILENLELNPKITSGDDVFNITGFMNGLGVAAKEYNSVDPSTTYVYIYDSSLPASGRIYYKVPRIGDSSSSTSSGNFFTICEIDVNRLSTDMVKVTDARRVGGGIYNSDELDKWFSTKQMISVRDKDSYIGNAFYGGDPTSFGSTVIIHIPSGVLFSTREKWINSLSGVVYDSLEAKERGTREFNFYLDQVIKRYISAGTDYILIPIDISGNFMNIVNLTYDYSV